MPVLLTNGESASADVGWTAPDHSYVAGVIRFDFAVCAESLATNIAEIFYAEWTDGGETFYDGLAWNGSAWVSLFGFDVSALPALTVGSHTLEIKFDTSTKTFIYRYDGVEFDLSSQYAVAVTGTDLWVNVIEVGQLFAPPGQKVYFFLIEFSTGDYGSSDILSDDFSGDLSLWSITGDASIIAEIPCPTSPATGQVIVKIYDLATNELADISLIALERQHTRALNQAMSFQVVAPAGHALLTSVADDGFPNLSVGDRKLIVWEDIAPTQPIFHGRISTVERAGDGNENLVTITALSPLAELGYEGNDQAGRIVRGSTVQPTAGDPYGEYDGNFINPLFASSVAAQAGISGPDLILQALTNSQNTGGESDPTPGEGPLPIDLTTGTFDLTVPDAVDLSPIEKMDWPHSLGDFIQTLCVTGVCDVAERPIDPTEDISIANPYLMAALSAESAHGSDNSGTVHFDYFTGSRNAGACHLLDDFKTVNNKLYDYLGPPQAGGTRWASNITPSLFPSGALHDAILASRARYGGPADPPGTFMQIRILDSIGSESDPTTRPLYIASWIAEQSARRGPRQILYITPIGGMAALFDAPTDFDTGDILAINVGADFGISLDATQRVYAFTKTWSRENVAQLAQLVTSADRSSA